MSGEKKILKGERREGKLKKEDEDEESVSSAESSKIISTIGKTDSNNIIKKEDDFLVKKPSVTQISSLAIYEKRERTHRYDKRRSVRKKAKLVYDNLCVEYQNFMLSNLQKQPKHRESPHIVINRSLRNIKLNSIFLKSAEVENESSLNRKISYQVREIGKRVRIYPAKEGRYMNIRLDECINNRVFILVPLKSVYDLPGTIFFNEDGKLMTKISEKNMQKAYVLLAIMEKVQKKDNFGIKFEKEDVNLCDKFWVNQIKTDGTFHFGTTGKIFSLGYGPKYRIFDSTLSIGEFAQKTGKFATTQVQLKNELKDKVYDFLSCSVNHVFSKFDNLQDTLSPNIAILQTHFDLNDKSREKEHQLQEKGILNAHICHNAQTLKKHTECDSSYTIICVPEQPVQISKKGKFNIAQFEFNMTDDKCLCVPLDPNTIIVYSGFLLTHRQQIQKLNSDLHPFINLVSYNSEKLFKHLMESFRRQINESNRRK